MENRSLPAIINDAALLKKPGFYQALTKNSLLNIHNPNIYLTLMLSFVFYTFYSRVYEGNSVSVTPGKKNYLTVKPVYKKLKF